MREGFSTHERNSPDESMRQACARQATPCSFTSWLHPANPRPLLGRYCKLYGGFPDVDKKQDEILKLSLQKRRVCGRSPGCFGYGLPAGCCTNHSEKGFQISLLQSFPTRRAEEFTVCQAWSSAPHAVHGETCFPLVLYLLLTETLRDVEDLGLHPHSRSVRT